MLISRRGFLKRLGIAALAATTVLTFLTCTGKAPLFYRFTDKIKSAKIESPLLYLATSESKDEKIEQLRQVAKKYSHRDSPFSDRTDPYVKKIEIAGELRTALFAPAPSRFLFSLKLPPKPLLDFGYSLIPDAWEFETSATVFKIWIVENGKEYLLFSDSIDPKNDESSRRWLDGRLDLSSYEGEHVKLVFETVQSGEGKTAYTYGLAVWSNPTLYSSTRKPSKPNVLLISIDTLRADHLSCYEYHRQTSPSIDKLAQEGILFKNAFSQCSWTIPSHGSIFTSKLPHRHGGTIDTSPGGTWHPLPPSNLTLAEFLRENGYITAAFTSGGYMITRNGLHQGFDLYYNNSGPGWDPFFNIERLVSRASNWLKRNRYTPFLLFFHTFEVHTPYIRQHFTEGLERGRLSDTVEHYRDLKYLKEATDAEKEYTIALYDGGIYHADRYIGMLLETLSQLGLSRNTIIILTSDHGEEFWEHYPQRAANHGHSGYDELLHVPLIFVLPHTDVKGRRISDQVRSLDIFPTILSALSIKYDKRSIDGESLLPLIKGSPQKELVAYSEDLHCGPERKVIRTKRYKYIYAPDLTQVREGHTGVDFYGKDVQFLAPLYQEELYDLEKDPSEKHNIAARQKTLVEKFRKQVRDIFNITTAKLEFDDAGENIRLSGVKKPIDFVTVSASPKKEWSTLSGSIKMIDDGKEYILTDFEPPLYDEIKRYLIFLSYSDKTTARITVERKSVRTVDIDADIIKQLKALGYMR